MLGLEPTTLGKKIDAVLSFIPTSSNIYQLYIFSSLFSFLT